MPPSLIRSMPSPTPSPKLSASTLLLLLRPRALVVLLGATLDHDLHLILSARTWVLEVRAWTPNSQRVPLQVSARIEPDGFAIIPPVGYAIPAIVCGDPTCLGPWRGYRAWIAFVRAYLGAIHKRLVMVRPVAVPLKEVVIPAARDRSVYQSTISNRIPMTRMFVSEE